MIKKRERRDNNLPSSGSTPNGHNNQTWTGPKPGARAGRLLFMIAATELPKANRVMYLQNKMGR